MEVLLDVNPDLGTKITRLSTSFKDGLTLGTGSAVYMVYEGNRMIYETYSLFDAYLRFVSPHGEPLNMVGNVDEGHILIVYSKKAYMKEKELGAFTNIQKLTEWLCRDIQMFIHKRDSVEGKRIAMLDYFYRNIGDSWEAILPNLDMRYVEINQLYRN